MADQAICLSSNHCRPRLRLWAWWLFASAVSGGLLGLAVQQRAWVPVAPEGFWLAGVLPGLAVLLLWPVLVVAVPQWLVLRQVLPHASRWILATFLGATGGSMVALFLVFQLLWHPALVLVPGAAGGVLLGWVQALAVREQIRGSGLWIVASSGAWAAIPTMLLLMGATVDPAASGAVILYGIVVGVVYGAITGLALVWLLRDQLAPVSR